MEQTQKEDKEITNDDLVKLFQKNTINIRNVCVLAHVDHGKTSLVDSLISYSNIISPRLAGDVRYMDSRPDEQERCITMKSSAISIPYYSDHFKDNYLINLIDSPGHVDFSSEIFSAMKIVDGALILIDVVEGICCQTENVIREAWDEKIKCVLVFNKMDKLITTLQLDPLEAYSVINNLLEKANALMGSLIVRDIQIDKQPNGKRKKSLNKEGEEEDNNNNNIDNEGEINVDDLIQEKENDFYFSPDKGNVIFCSAIDNWAFTISTFSDILSAKFGYKKEVLQKVLWGDYYYNGKSKKICSKPLNENSKPLFVEFILSNIYKLYQHITVIKDLTRITKITTDLKTQITSKELNQNTLDKNPYIILRTIMRQWLPIPSTVYDVLIQHLPNPIQGCKNKIDILFPFNKFHSNEFVSQLKESINKGIVKGDNIPTVAFISKMIPMQLKNIQGETLTNDNKDDVKFMAFARLFTGDCCRNNEFYIIGPKHDSKINKYDIINYKFDQLYYFMGQYIHRINQVHVGNIFSIGNLEANVFKTATISTAFDCPSILPQNINKSSNIKVSITSENIKEMNNLIQGLKKLNRSDPAVEYYVQSNGEHILVTSGEVHLERCVLDLESYLAKVKVKISEPIVNFKEGLGNKNYTYRKLKPKNKEDKVLRTEDELTKLKERKMDLDEYYVVLDGEKNIDITDAEEILQSCTPMVIAIENENDKRKPKVAKHKIKDVMSKNEKKVNNFIKKGNTTAPNASANITAMHSKQKGFAEDTTPNQFCSFGISAIGMEKETIEIIIHYQKLIDQIEESNFNLDKETYDTAMKFKKELLQSIESNKIKKIINNYLLSFGKKDGYLNMLLIKHISKQYAYFDRIKVIDSCIEKDINKDKENNIKESIIEDNKTISKSTDEEINDNLKGHTTVREFLNAVKIGFDIACKNGPLCEENMYGVIFIVEYIQFKTKKEDSKDTESNTIIKEDNTITITTTTKEKETTIISIEKQQQSINSSSKIIEEKVTDLSIIPIISNNKEEPNETKSISDQKQDSETILSTQINTYGPFLGQIMSTVKDCCRKAYLAGEPRLYEAIYLCTFQINQENIGKIHSVIDKRRGEITDEIPSDESIKCTIEAVVPVAESFGFVEEIRSKSSGLANPMLQFHQWKLLNVDPFDTASEQQIENYGVNIDTPNIAKTYINKIRQRKGLVTDEKLIKNADKQKNLAKKR